MATNLPEKLELTQEVVAQKWKEFKEGFGKTYSDENEENLRKKIFTEKLQAIEEHNEKYRHGLVTFTMGINHFSDRTKEELKSARGVLPSKKE